MVNYISENRKVLVTRNNGINKNLLCLEYDVEASLDFQIVDSNNQLVHIDDNLSGLYLAVGLKLGEPSRDLLALSKDYTISNDTIHFSLQTYTENWLNRVRKASTEAYFELGQMSLNQKRVIARDYCYVWPRCYIEGLSPQQIDTQNFYNKTEVNELVDAAEAELKNYADGQDAATLASATAYTDEQIASIDLSEYATDADLQAAKTELDGKIALKQDKITSENKLPYSLISNTPTIPTKTSELTNDSGYQTAQDVQNAISGKADTSALTAHTSDTEIHTTALEKAAWNAKAEVSDIPTDNAQLTNGAGYQTAQDVQNAISGKAETSYVDTELAKKQDKITAENKLDYALLSGTPTIPTTVSQLTNDSGYQTASDVETAISGKQDEITANNKLDFAMLSGVPEDNPALVPIELKTVASDCVYEVDFTGKAIQKYDLASATGGSNSIEIQFTNLANVPNGVAPTTELQIPVTEDDVSTITLPVGTQVVEMPDTLAYTSGKIAYHDIVFRAEKDVNDDMVVYCNYAYKFEEEEAV